MTKTPKRSLRGNRPRKQKGARPSGQRANQMIPHPPAIQEYALRHGVRMRFVTNAAFNGAITYQNLLDTILVATTNVAASDVFIAVKVKFVEVWSTPALGASSTIALTFAGSALGVVGDQRFHTDSSMGIEPAYIRASPAPKSLASQFQLSSAQVAFDLSCPIGTVVDCMLSFVGSANGGSVAAQNAIVAGVAGTTYFRGLDGLAIATTKFPQVTNANI